MKSIIQNKIDSLIDLSEQNILKSHSPKLSVKVSRDSLSQAIRTKRDAEIFKNELKVAINLSKEK